jgi:hypothetical protein
MHNAQKRLSFSIAVCLTVGLLRTVPGAAQEIPRSLASSVRWAESRESRRAQSKEWLEEIAKIERQIPTLSPTEKEWLRIEVDEEIARAGGRSTARSNVAERSREGLSRSTKPVAGAMVSILEALSTPSAALSESTEVVLWARLASIGLSNNFWADIARLGELGVLERTPSPILLGAADYQDQLLRTWAFRAVGILRQIVLP